MNNRQKSWNQSLLNTPKLFLPHCTTSLSSIHSAPTQLLISFKDLTFWQQLYTGLNGSSSMSACSLSQSTASRSPFLEKWVTLSIISFRVLSLSSSTVLPRQVKIVLLPTSSFMNLLWMLWYKSDTAKSPWKSSTSYLRVFRSAVTRSSMAWTASFSPEISQSVVGCTSSSSQSSVATSHQLRCACSSSSLLVHFRQLVCQPTAQPLFSNLSWHWFSMDLLQSTPIYLVLPTLLLASIILARSWPKPQPRSTTASASFVIIISFNSLSDSLVIVVGMLYHALENIRLLALLIICFLSICILFVGI